MQYDYTLIRSSRRSVGIRILPEGTVEVRAPRFVSKREIDRVVESHARWIEEHRARVLEKAARFPEPDEEEKKVYIKYAREKLPPLIARYAAQMGVTPTGLTITGARTRFGSCSSKGRLSFSWRLMRYPDAAIEAVVVHELAHLKQMNHSPAFYAEVLRVLPDYYERKKLLK